MNLVKRAAFTLALSLAAPAFVWAQSPSNPVVAHFRAYQAALERGDLASAETEANAALEASVARSGDGGSTGALAINLAQTRLMQGKRAEAYEPAMRAFTIASSGGANLDPLLTRILLGRAELTDERWRQGRDRLQAAIAESRARPDLNAETYNAAADLGRWLFNQEQFSGALDAWEIAKQMADAAGGGNDYARAEARMGHAVASFTRAMTSVVETQARPTGTRLDLNADEAFSSANEELLEAQNLIGPFAFTPSSDGGITLGQSMYASIVAWRTLLSAFAQSRGFRSLPVTVAEFQVSQADPRPVCRTRPIVEPRPDFPTGASTAFAAGAVVVRFSIDESGHVIDRRVAAAIPGRWFREAVERVAPRWSVERLPDSDPNCRYNPIEFLSVKFSFAE